VPVEVVPFGSSPATRALEGLGARVTLRRGTNGQTWVSDNGNYILDCHFGPIADAVALQQQILAIPAVIDSGLFLGLTDTVLIGHAEGVRRLERYQRSQERTMEHHGISVHAVLPALAARAADVWSLDACGVTRSQTSIPALVHRDAYTPVTPRTRVLLVGGLSGYPHDVTLAIN